MLAARLTEGIPDRRRVPENLLDRGRLGGDVVEGAERVARSLLPRCLVEFSRVLLEPRAQLLQVRGAALRVADGIQLEPVLRHAEAPEERVVELDHLGVERRILRADRLDVQLPVLAVAAFCGRP